MCLESELAPRARTPRRLTNHTNDSFDAITSARKTDTQRLEKSQERLVFKIFSNEHHTSRGNIARHADQPPSVQLSALIHNAALLFLTGAVPAPAFAEAGKDIVRIEKLEERMRNIEARMAKAETPHDKQMGMMNHDHGGQGTGMGTNDPMGQAPQQGGSAMPQAGTQQPP